ncbi:MAG TPA: glycosyltransferase [Solibacterales bacterium]|nr:glycosyltransferase [Bryobacterales bacterium]
MKLAIVVHGRFDGFDLARALIARGHAVTVFTNYPKWAARRFGLPDQSVRSFWLEGALSKGLHGLHQWKLLPNLDSKTHSLFGRWAAQALVKEQWNLVYAFSGVAEEVLNCLPAGACQRWVARGSAHIRTQDQLLADEGRRLGLPIERPTPWMVAREEREYQLADRIVTLSSFARHSFLERGVPPERVLLIRSGVNSSVFRASQSAVLARQQRMRSGQPLRVLYAGTFSLQKGMADLTRVVEQSDPAQVRFQFLSNIASDAASLFRRIKHRAEMLPRVAEQDLPQQYAAADLFVFASIQDGFGAVLAQANANALPIIATTNCAAPDLLKEGETGWVVPIRQPGAILAQLQWCHEHRSELAEMVERIHREFLPRTWDDVAADFERHLAG